MCGGRGVDGGETRAGWAGWTCPSLPQMTAEEWAPPPNHGPSRAAVPSSRCPFQHPFKLALHNGCIDSSDQPGHARNIHDPALPSPHPRSPAVELTSYLYTNAPQRRRRSQHERSHARSSAPARHEHAQPLHHQPIFATTAAARHGLCQPPLDPLCYQVIRQLRRCQVIVLRFSDEL